MPCFISVQKQKPWTIENEELTGEGNGKSSKDKELAQESSTCVPSTSSKVPTLVAACSSASLFSSSCC
jgi:hypothetical protein